MKKFFEYYINKGHVFGECMSHPSTDLMYVYIPKNASSWTKPNLKDWNWETYNYHTDNLYYKKSLIVLRDPIERWLSGIAEYMYLYHNSLDIAYFSKNFYDIIFDKIALDDHTEKQVLFIEGLTLSNCTFFLCDENYRINFSAFLKEHGMNNRYHNYEYQHTSESSEERQRFKNIFRNALKNNSKYMKNLKKYFSEDYQLIESVKFYAG